MLKSVAVVITGILLGSFGLAGQEPEKAPPSKELIQYVQEAQKAGQNAFQIEQNAVAAGWPTVSVDDAIAYVKSLDKEKSPADSEKKDVASAGNTLGGTPRPATASPAEVSHATADSPAAPAKEAKPGSDPSASPPADGTAGTVPKAGAPVGLDYQIGAGDVLRITVWREPDASPQSTVVLPNGRISMPLLHEIEVAGMTVPQLEQYLTEKLSAFINVPVVSVGIVQMNSKKIYITGKVRKEGPLPYSYQMTVMQALTEAGGVTDFAKKKGIYVLRTENGKQQFMFAFDYAAVLKGKHLESNIVLIPGDMIVVP
jgi:polysaccharide export outer membrane protein